MDSRWKSMIWQQFGATLDMLEDALLACPDEHWETPLWGQGTPEAAFSPFWNLISHVLFWTDLYLHGTEEGFAPPTPFGLEELDPAGKVPEPPFSKAQLQTYLHHCREKCRTTIEALSDERALETCRFPWGEVPFLELLLYNMRHVQEHAAQLSLFLGQHISSPPGWVTVARATQDEA